MHTSHVIPARHQITWSQHDIKSCDPSTTSSSVTNIPFGRGWPAEKFLSYLYMYFWVKGSGSKGIQKLRTWWQQMSNMGRSTWWPSFHHSFYRKVGGGHPLPLPRGSTTSGCFSWDSNSEFRNLLTMHLALSCNRFDFQLCNERYKSLVDVSLCFSSWWAHKQKQCSCLHSSI